jgi:parallel beta-helix repeat protein
MDRIDRLQGHVEALEQQTEMLMEHTRTVERRLRWWRGIACGVVMLFGALGIALGSVTPAHADGIQCGDILGPGGRFELEHDLDCPSPPPLPAITVRDRAILDLKRHIVTCHNFERCIVLTGTGAQLLNGAVDGGAHASIVLEGNGGHIVKNVTSTLVDSNIHVLSDHNQLINVMAESVFMSAFLIAGNHNRLTDSIASCFGSPISPGCITVPGHENRLIDNFATGIDFGGNGFAIMGHNNVLRGNRAIRNDGRGIVVSGTGNRLSRNTALENGLDLRDTNGDCAHNTWGQNTFKTSDPACIGQTAGESVVDLVR